MDPVIELRIKNNLLKFFFHDMHFPQGITQSVNIMKDKKLRNYIWYIRDVCFEGNMGCCTLDYFAKILFYRRDISDEAFQMIIRDYFLKFLHLLNIRGYFLPPIQNPLRTLKNEYKDYMEGRLDTMLRHYDNDSYLFSEMTKTFQLYFRVFMDDDFKLYVLKPRLLTTIQNYYKTKQNHLIQTHYPHKKIEELSHDMQYVQLENEYILGVALNEQDVIAYINSLQIGFLDE